MLKIFVNTWGNYNENGADNGEWLTLPMDPEELEEELDRIAENMGDTDPEWFVNDYEWETDFSPFDVEENENLLDLNEKAQRLEDLEEWDKKAFSAIAEARGGSFEEIMDILEGGDYCFYEGMDLEDVAYELVEECYFTKETPEIFKIYFDYSAFARDLSFDGYTETKYGVVFIA